MRGLQDVGILNVFEATTPGAPCGYQLHVNILVRVGGGGAYLSVSHPQVLFVLHSL